MTDFFLLLQESRRPWIEPELLKEKFLSLSAQTHPDRVHGREEAERRAAHDRYARLNAAYQCLLNPKDRLRHLLELERGAAPTELQEIPGDLMDQFLEIGRICREADALASEKKAGGDSPLLQVQAFQRSQQCTGRIRQLQEKLKQRQKRLTEDLKGLDAEWRRSPASQDRTSQLARLEQCYRLFGFYGRWEQQLQERLVQLSF